MENPYRRSDDGKCLVSDIEPGWTLEYYFKDHLLWVREDRHSNVREMPVSEYLLQDPLERAAYFAEIEL